MTFLQGSHELQIETNRDTAHDFEPSPPGLEEQTDGVVRNFKKLTEKPENKSVIEYEINRIGGSTARLRNNLFDYRLGQEIFVRSLRPDQADLDILMQAMKDMSYLTYSGDEKLGNGNYNKRVELAKEIISVFAKLINAIDEESLSVALKKIKNTYH